MADHDRPCATNARPETTVKFDVGSTAHHLGLTYPVCRPETRGGKLLADIGYEVSSDQLEVEYTDYSLYLYDSRAGSDSPYEVPRSAPAYLSGPMTGAGWAPLGSYITGTGSAEGFGFIPSTNAMTAHGLPTEEVFALFNRAQNLGPDDGVSQTSTASPTSVLVTLAAAGRNPTDITLPTVGSQAGGGGDEEDDAAASPSSSSTPASSTATASAGSSGGGSSGATAKAPAAGSSGASSAGSSGSDAAVEGGSGNATGDGEVAPTDETGGDDEGAHLTFEQMTILAAQGYDPANIIQADAALAAGASDETIMLVLGRRAPDQAAKEPPVAQSARTTDEVVMELVEKAEPVLRPIMVRGGAILNASGDVGGIFLGVSIALAPEASIPTIIGGTLLAAASADDLGANSVTVVTAEPQQSVVQSGVRAGALKLGSSEQDAQNLEQLSTIFLRSTQAWNAAMVFPPGPAAGPVRVRTLESFRAEAESIAAARAGFARTVAMEDPGMWGSINPTQDKIMFVQSELSGGGINRVSPFNQSLSDSGGQPIRVVVAESGEKYIMQGNHRIYGAKEQGLQKVEVIIYTPEQWEILTEGPFVPSGTNNPRIVP